MIEGAGVGFPSVEVIDTFEGVIIGGYIRGHIAVAGVIVGAKNVGSIGTCVVDKSVRIGGVREVKSASR